MPDPRQLVGCRLSSKLLLSGLLFGRRTDAAKELGLGDGENASPLI